MGGIQKFSGLTQVVRGNFRHQLILIALLLLCGAAWRVKAQPASLPDLSFWTPDGPVNAILVTNNTIYLGGEFSYVGPRTGPLGLFDIGTAQSQALPPTIFGVVKAVLSDGNGGWFVGGAFTRIGEKAVTNVAHLNGDLSLDVNWSARLVGTTVNALALNGGRLYIGGNFPRIGGVARPNLASVNANDGSLTTWDPQLSGTVNAMAVANNLLYAGGSFFSVGASNRANLVALTLDTAAVTPWLPEADSTVLTLTVSGTTIYVGGQFATVGTKPRARLAALDNAAGVASNWNPNPNGTVRALYVLGSTVYAGGDFTTIGGQNRRGIAAINAGNGAAQAFNMQLQSPTTTSLVRGILVENNVIYAVGSMTGAGTDTRPMIAALDLGTGLPPAALPLGTVFNGSASAAFGINTIAAAGGRLLVGGEFSSFGGVARQRAAALSAITGQALPWAPSFSGSVLCLAYGTNRIYVGGSFTNLYDTNVVKGLVALDPVSGNRLFFSFDGTNTFADTIIRSLIVTPTALYVGGNFSGVSGSARRFVAVVDPASGVGPTAFDAKLGGGNDGIYAMVRAGTNLYLAGDFGTVNSQSRVRLAAVSANNGNAVTTWTPVPNQTVTSLSLGPDTLYVGGNFTTISSTALRNFAAYNLADNSLAGLDAALSLQAQGVTAIGATPTSLYVSGYFDSIGGEFRQNQAVLIPFNAASMDWDPAPDVPPTAIAVTDAFACLGGSFRFLGRSPTNRVHGFLAVYRRGPQFIKPLALQPPNAVRMVATTGDLTDCVLQGTSDLTSPAWTNLATNDLPGYVWTLDYPVGPSETRFFRLMAR